MGAPRIDTVTLARYVGPGRAIRRPHGLVVRLVAAGVAGIGEAVVAGDTTEAAWRELRHLAGQLVGATLPAQVDPAAPLSRIRGWQPVGATDRGPRRAAKLALELALLDVVLKRAGEAGGSVAAPAPSATPLPVHPLPRVEPGSPLEDLTDAVAAEPASAAMLRLRLTGDPEHDLAWIRHLSRVERKAGRDRPLWLVGGGGNREEAADFVRRLAAAMAAGEVVDQVLWEEPVVRKQQSLLSKLRQRSPLGRLSGRPELAALQRLADQLLGEGQPRPRLSILAGQSVVSPAQAAALAGRIGGLHLSLSRFGSLVALREAARAVKRAAPQTTVLLAHERGSGITRSVLHTVAHTTPEIDLHLPEPPASGWPELTGTPAEESHRRGLVDELDLAELSTVADGVVTLPEPKRPAAAVPPNRFPDYPLAGAALAVRSMLLETEALRLGLATRRLARDFFLVERPGTGQSLGFFDSESTQTSVAASMAAADKGVTRILLERAGLPVPEGATFPATARDQAYQAGLALGFPLVVKPAGGSKGTAVTTGITSETALARALDEVIASKYADTGIVIERFATGHDYRLLVTRRGLLSVVRREPASVIGDGQRSVEELVLAANVVRRHNPHLGKRLIRLDERVDEQLAQQGLTRHSVPAAGQRVQLRAEANLSLGGDSREVRDETHPSFQELAVAVLDAIPGLPYAGLDVLLEDHRIPVDQQQVTIIEVNSRPVQSLHHFPMYGPPRNVSVDLVREAVVAAGWPVTTPTDQLTVALTVAGRVDSRSYQRWLAGMAGPLGVSGWIGDGGEGRIEGVLHGAPPRVGLLLRLAFHGPADAGIVETRAVPVDVTVPDGFTVGRKGRSA